jgi:hypothetical protein
MTMLALRKYPVLGNSLEVCEIKFEAQKLSTMTTNEIITAFRQGGTGNCVSIAVIKAGLEVFGMDKIFHATWKNNTTLAITMRDGFEVTLSPDDIRAAVRGSRFIKLESQEVFNYANVCFAAMAKRAQTEKNDDFGPMSFEQAIQTLNDGEYYTEGPNWLGLRHHTRNIGRKYIFHYPGVIGASRKHCFFVSYGMEDNYGVADPITGLENRFCRWLRISADQVY